MNNEIVTSAEIAACLKFILKEFVEKAVDLYKAFNADEGFPAIIKIICICTTCVK